ncbi:hypothetical protein LR48_Vigan05g181500 [Vigna angularis]|uniref:Uncharacterized protein n=1 Tax=Phaseolus angularis TaxID=3914 RepID=A0A0L9UMS6_PHAAN|nr:hypothetical protein LR48_Vigan05g181500 [Vigna angularis]
MPRLQLDPRANDDRYLYTRYNFSVSLNLFIFTLEQLLLSRCSPFSSVLSHSSHSRAQSRRLPLPPPFFPSVSSSSSTAQDLSLQIHRSGSTAPDQLLQIAKPLQIGEPSVVATATAAASAILPLRE